MRGRNPIFIFLLIGAAIGVYGGYWLGKESADRWYAKQPHMTIVGAGVPWSAITSADGGSGQFIEGTSKPGKPIEWHHAKPKVKIINCEKAVVCIEDDKIKSHWEFDGMMIDESQHKVYPTCPKPDLQIEPLPWTPFNPPSWGSPVQPDIILLNRDVQN